MDEWLISVKQFLTEHETFFYEHESEDVLMGRQGLPQKLS